MASYIECKLLAVLLLQCRLSFVEAELPFFVAFSTGFGVIFENEYVPGTWYVTTRTAVLF